MDEVYIGSSSMIANSSHVVKSFLAYLIIIVIQPKL